MRGGIRPSGLAWLLAPIALLSAKPSAAGEPSAADKETSRNLYAEGVRLLDAHDYAGAESACRGAHAIVRVPTASRCLGRALEGLGRLVEARDVFLEAVHYPAVSGEPAVFTDARIEASAEAEALASRIPSVVIVVAGSPDTTRLHATIDGAAIASDTVRLPRKVDPGRHVIVVSAPGFQEARAEVTVPEGQEERVAIDLQRAGGDETSTTPSSPTAGTGHAVESPTAAESGGRKLLAFVVGGVGIAGLAVGSVVGLMAGSKWSSAKTDCGSGCGPNDPAQQEKSDAATMGNVSTVGFVAGGALVVAGLVLYMTAPSGSTGSAGLRVVPSASAGGGGISLRGAF
jgi:PEGA domain